MKNCQEAYPPSLYGNLLQIVHDAIIVINREHAIIFANRRAAQMFAMELNQFLGLPFASLFMADDRDILVPNILHLTTHDGEFEGECMLLRRDNTTFQGLIAASAFQLDKNIAGIAMTIHDITEMKAIQQTLSESERLFFLGRMLDDISHQIRNPVMVIGGLCKRLDVKESYARRIDAIQREASYLEALLDSINSFIRLPKPCLRHNTIAEIIEAAETNFKDMATELGCTWQGKYEEGIGEESLIIDMDLILKALEALVVNACESYSTPGPENMVTFAVGRSSDPTWPFTITIRDQGCGISPEYTSHIFSQFFTNKTKHIGMGLTFAKKIVEEQMDRIEVQSRYAEGTAVFIHLAKERRRPIRTTLLEDE